MGGFAAPTGCAARANSEAIHALPLFLDHSVGPIIWSPAVFVSEQVVVVVNIVPVDRDRHAGKGWRHSRDYSFAAQLVSVRLVGAELASAAVAMPVAFIEHSGRYLVAGVMSPLPGRNLFVAPDGRWLGAYVPAAFRSYPFSLARVEGSDRAILCIDENSGWVVDSGVNADVTKFFDEDGRPSLATKATLDFLQQIEWSRTITDLAVAALADARVIQPWPLNVHDGYQQVQVNGLHRILRITSDQRAHPRRSASTGWRVAARRAGYQPKVTPKPVARRIAATIVAGCMRTCHPKVLATSQAEADPRATPANPPAVASAAASTRN